MDRSRLQGRWWGSRDGDDNMMEKEGHTGAFDHCDGVAVYDNKRRGKNQGEKILTSGKTRISNIVKINIIITSYYSPTISYKTFLKIAPNLNIFSPWFLPRRLLSYTATPSQWSNAPVWPSFSIILSSPSLLPHHRPCNLDLSILLSSY